MAKLPSYSHLKLLPSCCTFCTLYSNLDKKYTTVYTGGTCVFSFSSSLTCHLNFSNCSLFSSPYLLSLLYKFLSDKHWSQKETDEKRLKDECLVSENRNDNTGCCVWLFVFAILLFLFYFILFLQGHIKLFIFKKSHALNRINNFGCLNILLGSWAKLVCIKWMPLRNHGRLQLPLLGRFLRSWFTPCITMEVDTRTAQQYKRHSVALAKITGESWWRWKKKCLHHFSADHNS